MRGRRYAQIEASVVAGVLLLDLFYGLGVVGEVAAPTVQGVQYTLEELLDVVASLGRYLEVVELELRSDLFGLLFGDLAE